MRNAFVRTLTALAKDDPSLMLLTGDLGFTVLENFRDTYPNQYLNAGVAEQNMIGVACGLALSGKRVFVYSIVPFVTFRCFEQIRNDLCYHHLPVCIVGVGAGYSYGHMGSTHHALEDVSVMRSLPSMTVVCPGDPLEVEGAVRAIATLNGPAYLRLGKAGEPILHDKDHFDFTLGKAIRMIDGRDVAILASSVMLDTAKKVAASLTDQNVSVRLLSMHTIKPIDRVAIEAAARETKLIVTIEEHSSIGGLSSAVAEVLSALPTHAPQLTFSAPDQFTDTVGSQNFLRARTSLDEKTITTSILSALKR